MPALAKPPPSLSVQHIINFEKPEDSGHQKGRTSPSETTPPPPCPQNVCTGQTPPPACVRPLWNPKNIILLTIYHHIKLKIISFRILLHFC